MDADGCNHEAKSAAARVDSRRRLHAMAPVPDASQPAPRRILAEFHSFRTPRHRPSRDQELRPGFWYSSRCELANNGLQVRTL